MKKDEEKDGFGTEEVMTRREILHFRERKRKIREWSLR